VMNPPSGRLSPPFARLREALEAEADVATAN
jgi:hypothetical protein